jgi:hypothetical protein
MTGLQLVVGRSYVDRRGRVWSCVTIVPSVARGQSVAVCRDDHGVPQIYRLDGRALATGALSWFDLVTEA